jgi:hypothetical protein
MIHESEYLLITSTISSTSHGQGYNKEAFFIVLSYLWGKAFFMPFERKEIKMKEKKNVFKAILGTVVLFSVAAILLYVYFNKNDTATEGRKEILVQVIVPDEETAEFTIITEAETLREALDEKNLIDGEESIYGLLITEVNGRKIDESKQEWWSLTKDGEFSEYGVDMIKIQDKDKYELTLMVGY